MAWIESHQELGEHPKRKKLSRLLGCSKPATIGHLHCLWWWVLDYADDGDLTRFDPEEMAAAAEWEGDPIRFTEAMVVAEFLDRDGDRLSVHDLDDYVGRLVVKREAGREANRERQRRWRSRQQQESVTDRDAEAGNADVTRYGGVNNGPTQHDTTLTNTTQPNTTTPPTLSAPVSSSSSYEDQLSKRFATFTAQFASLDPLLDEQWLRETLRRVEPEIGPLPVDRLGKGLGLAHRQIDLRFKAVAAAEAKLVHSPRKFAETIVVSQLKEQRDGIPSPSGGANGVRAGPAPTQATARADRR